MINIAVLMNVSFGVVYNAKVKEIPTKRIKQFSDALCIEPEILLNGTTAVFSSLHETIEPQIRIYKIYYRSAVGSYTRGRLQVF